MKIKLPGGSELVAADTRVRDDLLVTPEPLQGELEKIFVGALRAREVHLETFFAAFVKEVGPERASDYELVEDWSDGKKIRWYFRRR